jgi:hypothetical protein
LKRFDGIAAQMENTPVRLGFAASLVALTAG